MAHRVLAVVTDRLDGPEPLQELRGLDDGGGLELRVVVPAVEATAFRHTLGDVDGPKREAEARLAGTLEALRRQGIQADGEVGDPDPVQAAQDALLLQSADEVVIFEHDEQQARWFEDGLFERAKAGLDPPLRMVVLHQDRDGARHVEGIEEAGAGLKDPQAASKLHSVVYAPGLGFTRGDLAGVLAGIFGTIVAAILAAAVTAKSGTGGPEAAAILIAIGIALINMAYVVGLTLMESVRYRGGFATFFRALSLVGTPVAVLANLVLLIAS